MSDLSFPKSKPTLVAAAVGTAVVLVTGSVFVMTRSGHRSEAPTQVTSLPTAATAVAEDETETAKVGDLTVTEEALELAEIKLADATARTVAEKLPVSGSVEATGDRLVKVTPRVAGKLLTVSVTAGDPVRAGQTLATVESTELAKAQAEYEHAVIALGAARKALTRQQKMARLGAFGRPRAEEARKEVATAEGEATAAEKEVNAAKHEVVKARSQRAALQGEVAEAESGVTAVENEAVGYQSQVSRAQGQVKSLQAALAQAQTQVKVNQSRFNRLDTLLKEQLASKQDWEQAQADLERSKSDVEAARANIEQAEAEVENVRAQLRALQSKVTAAQARVRTAKERVQEAGSEIEAAQARQEQAEARLVATRKRTEISQQALAREERVFTGGFATSKEIVEAEAHLQEAEHELEHSERAVRLLGGRPGGGAIVTVTAPIAGRVQVRSASIGQTVETGSELFTVINLDLVWAQLAVAPRDLSLVRAGQQVILTSETAPGRTFTGSVSSVGSEADEKTRSVRVRVALTNRDGALRPETFVRGNILTDVRRERLTVPLDALQEHTGKDTLYVAVGDKPGAFEVRHVTLGVHGDGWREVTSGLEAGEKIATGGTFYLKSEALKSALSDSCCGGDEK